MPFLLFGIFRIEELLPSDLDDDDIWERCTGNGLDFETVHNIDEYSTETVSTMREALKVFEDKTDYFYLNLISFLWLQNYI